MVATWKTTRQSLQLSLSSTEPFVLFASSPRFDDVQHASAFFRQYLAAVTWQRMDTADVLLLTDDAVATAMGSSLGFATDSHYESRSDNGLPLFPSLCRRVLELYPTHHWFMYTNSDMMYEPREVVETVRALQHDKRPLLGVGVRRNLDAMYSMACMASADGCLREQAKAHSELFSSWAFEFFIMPRRLLEVLALHSPNYTIATPAFDNTVVLLAHLGPRRHFVVDVSDTVTALHLNHGDPWMSHSRAGAERNLELFRRFRQDYNVPGDGTECTLCQFASAQLATMRNDVGATSERPIYLCDHKEACEHMDQASYVALCQANS
jgi:hypothetical protein